MPHQWHGALRAGLLLHTASFRERVCGFRNARPSFFTMAASGLVCGGAFLVQQQLQTECAAAERHTDFVVVGGGLSAMGGVHGVRKVDKNSLVTVVCPNPSRAFTTGSCTADSVREGGTCVDFCALEEVDLQNVTFDRTAAVELDVDKQVVTLRDGGRLHYKKGCLIASDAMVAARPANTFSDSALKYVRLMGGSTHEIVDTVAKATVFISFLMLFLHSCGVIAEFCHRKKETSGM
jgi:hypothetical protein